MYIATVANQPDPVLYQNVSIHSSLFMETISLPPRSRPTSNHIAKTRRSCSQTIIEVNQDQNINTLKP